jgi:CDP-paratose 2-epimerase
MKTAIVTGSAGLIGSEAARRLLADGYHVVGIDNNMRQVFFGADGNTDSVRQDLQRLRRYEHASIDIRDAAAVLALFREHAPRISLVIHAAAQPSHDWAAREPHTDFGVNAVGTLNLLEAARQTAREATFAFLSTNKVYGDRPNSLPLVEEERRWEVARDHAYHARGIDESMSIDQCTHSLFGVSKTAADLLVQEYGRYFGMPTVCFRGGCLTGPNHAGARLHGFLAYLMKCCIDGTRYTVCGYKAKQVRDNIHSQDLVAALLAFHSAPRAAEVYNIGGGRRNSCSVLEAIDLSEKVSGRKMNWDYSETHRIGDHIWWISDTSKFEQHHPAWRQAYTLQQTLQEIFEANRRRAA